MLAASDVRTRVPDLAAALLGIVSIGCVWATAPMRHAEFHSDLLYLPALARDLLEQPSSVLGWHLAPAPYLVPDLVVYLLLRAATGSVEAAFTAYAMTFAAGLLAGMCYVTHRFRVASFAQTMLVGSAVVIALAFYSRADLGTVVLLPSCHGSLCVMALFAVGWVQRSLTPRRLALTSIVGGLLLLSDGLALAQIVLPLLLATRRRDLLRAAVLAVVVSITLRVLLALAGIDLPSALPSPQSWWRRLSSADHWAGLPRAFGEIATSWPVIVALALGGAFTAWLAPRTREARRLSIFLFATAACTLVLPVVTALFFDVGGARYLLPCLIVLPLGLVLLLGRVSTGAHAALTAVAAVAGAFVIGDARAAPPIRPASSDAIACLDEVAREEGLRRGVGDYWDAKLVDHHSQRGLRVNQLRPSLEPYGWISNDRWLLDEHGALAPPEFVLVPREARRGYVLDRGPLAGLVEERLGPPARRVDCGRFDVLVYQRHFAARAFTRVQSRLLLGRPPSEVEGLTGYVPDLADPRGLPFRGVHTVRFASAVRGDYLDVSAPAPARWRIVLLGAGDRDVGSVELPPMTARGPMRVRLLPLPEAARNVPLSGVRIEPLANGDQLLGHLFLDDSTAP